MLRLLPSVLGAVKLPGDSAPIFPLVPQLIPPVLLFVLAAVGAVGIILLLPGRREAPLRAIGAVVLTATLLIFAAFIGKTAAGMGIYFWIFSAIAIIAAARVVTHPKPV